MAADFTTTKWTVVLAARGGSDTRARHALEALCEAYWYPMYAYARRRGYDAEGAADITQAFFADLIERKALGQVDRAQGRFRAFLLASMRNFMSHERDHAQTLKRGGGTTIRSLDNDEAERRFDLEPAEELTPDQLFERRWGRTVMERAMSRLATDSGGDRAPIFEALRPFLTGGDGTPYRDVADRLAMTEGAVKTAVHRLRRSYGTYLRQEIAETVASESEVDDELRHLLTVIRPLRA